MRLRDDKKHQAICDAAIELITTNGFAETSMSKIAKAANVSPSTIYIYFENKEDLLNKVYLMVKREKSQAMLKGFDEKLPVKKAFHLLWTNFFKYATENPANFKFGEQFLHSPLVNRVSKDEGMSYYQPMFELFERGKREKIFKDLSVEVFGAFTFSPLMDLIKQHLSGEITLNKKTLDEVFAISWDSVTE